MPTSLSKPERQHSRIHWAAAALAVYGAMCVGLLGYFIAFPDKATQKAQIEKRLAPDPAQFAKKQGRYEGVIANWDRYRARNLRAEAR